MTMTMNKHVEDDKKSHTEWVQEMSYRVLINYAKAMSYIIVFVVLLLLW